MRSSWVKQIPNALSLTRVGIAFIFPFVPLVWRLPLIVIALLSEFFDGFLARRLNAESTLGQALDPIADKLFVLSTVGILIAEQRITPLSLVLVAMRDIVVVIGSISVTLESRNRAFLYLKPRWSGKVTTAFQFALLVSLYASWKLSPQLLVLTAVISSMSAIDYLYAVLHRRFDQVTSEPRPLAPLPRYDQEPSSARLAQESRH